MGILDGPNGCKWWVIYGNKWLYMVLVYTCIDWQWLVRGTLMPPLQREIWEDEPDVSHDRKWCHTCTCFLKSLVHANVWTCMILVYILSHIEHIYIYILRLQYCLISMNFIRRKTMQNLWEESSDASPLLLSGGGFSCRDSSLLTEYRSRCASVVQLGGYPGYTQRGRQLILCSSEQLMNRVSYNLLHITYRIQWFQCSRPRGIRQVPVIKCLLMMQPTASCIVFSFLRCSAAHNWQTQRNRWMLATWIFPWWARTGRSWPQCNGLGEEMRGNKYDHIIPYQISTGCCKIICYLMSFIYGYLLQWQYCKCTLRKMSQLMGGSCRHIS